jgi:hypothetical protein
MPTCFTAIRSVTPTALASFSHIVLFSPALSSLAIALPKGFLPQLLDLRMKTPQMYPPQSDATKGHFGQIHKNLRSTKSHLSTLDKPLPVLNTDNNGDGFPTSDVTNKSTHHCYAAAMTPGGTKHIHSDQTRQSPVASSAGNSCTLLV